MARLALDKTTYAKSQLGLGGSMELDDLVQATQTELDALTAADATAATYLPLYSSLAADSVAKNANITVVATGLTVTLPIAGTYIIDAVLPYTTSAAADIRIQFAGTATVTATVGVSDIYRVNSPFGDATAAAVPLRIATSWTTEQVVATTGALAAANPLVYTGKLVATVAGTITIAFAQGTSDATDTKVNAGAYLTARRVA